VEDAISLDSLGTSRHFTLSAPLTPSRRAMPLCVRDCVTATKVVFKPSDMYGKYLNIDSRMAVYCVCNIWNIVTRCGILGGNGRTFIVRRAFEQCEASTTGRSITKGEVFHISNPYIGLLVDAGFDATNAVWHAGFCRRERHPTSSRLVSQDARFYNCRSRGALW
jgi:hypothetical protein